MARKTYAVIAKRVDGWWLLQLADEDITTRVRRLERAEAEVRPLVASAQRRDPDSFDIAIGVALPADIQTLVSRAETQRMGARAAQTKATAAARLAARRLTELGMSMRDTGRILGVSHQRVAQLLATDQSPQLWIDMLASSDPSSSN